MIGTSRFLAFVVGLVSLAGQVCWSRLAATVVGGTFAAWAITLFGAMAGLSIGSAWAGRKRFSPAAVLAVAGLILIATPLAMLEIGGLAGMPTLRVFLVALLLGGAHLPFGAFLPSLVAWRRLEAKELGREGGRLYALGSLGAVVGALGAAEILPGLLGLDHLGILLGAIMLACTLRVRRNPDGGAKPATDSQEGRSVPAPLLLSAFALGVLGLVTESLWMRIFGFYWESNTLCYALVTAATVGGLSAGSWVASRFPSKGGIGVALSAAAIGLAVAAAGAPLAGRAIGSGERILTAFVLVGLPASMFGAAFVLLLGCAGTKGSGARVLGLLSAANGAGAALGPLLLWGGGSWISWPTQMLFIVAAVSAALLAVAMGRRALWPGLALSMTIGLSGWFLAPPGPVLADFQGTAETTTIPYRRASLESTVTVTRNNLTGMEIVWIDRGFQGDTSPLGRRIPERLGSVSCDLLGKTPSKAMVIGLGTGITLSAIVDSGARSVDVAELSEGVIDANRTILAEINRSVLQRPGVRVHHGDGRPFLLDAPGAYDLIVADMIFPTVLGAGNLFSREFYGLARERLAPEGVFVHWVPCFLLSPEDLSAVAAAFLSEFPEGSAWIGYFGPSRLVLGLAGGSIRPAGGRLALGPEELRKLAGDTSPIRDADPRLETRSRGGGFGPANLKRVTELMKARSDSESMAWIAFSQAEAAEEGRLQDRAAALYREASRLAPGTTDAEFRMTAVAFERDLEGARHAWELGNIDLMTTHLGRAAAHTGFGLGNLYLADVLVAQGRGEEAAAELRKAVAKCPRSPDARAKLAWIARLLGDPVTADRELEVASALRRGTIP